MATDGMYRIGIVGASSLLAKELGDELQESLLAASDFVLFDTEEAAGVVTATGDEAAVVRQVEAGSFARMDFVFFAGDAAATLQHWGEARRAGASLVDMTYALEGERGVLVRAPAVGEALKAEARAAGGVGYPNLETSAVVAAHPAAVMLGLVAARVQAAVKVRSLAATVVEPASEHGREAMDELHQQTVNLLSFQTLPKEQYDAQVAFNVLPSVGEGAKVNLLGTEERIARHYALLGALPTLDLELVQAPVFHGYVASVMLELEEEATAAEIEAALAGDGIDVVGEEGDPPSNLSAAGQEDVMVRVKSTGGREERARRFWLWVAADNLKLAALNGIACANELRRLRPRGKVQ